MIAECLGIQFSMCDAYIDRGRKIGEDPVGYKCCKILDKSSSFNWHVVDDHEVCDCCYELMLKESERVSF
jgi:hypothetical protein